MSSPAARSELPGEERLVRAGLQLAFWLPLLICTYLALTPAPPTAVSAISVAVLNALASLGLTSAPPDALYGAGDVVLHALAFCYLTFALGLALPGAGPAVVGAYMLGYGGFLELAQSEQPTRAAEWKDLLVDLGGIAVGLGLLWLCGRPCRRLVRATARWVSGFSRA